MATSPAVSVLITAYNSRGLVREAVDSVLAQTLDDFEIVVVDDCSTDDTPQVLGSFADPRIHVVRNPANLGVSRSRNLGLELARAEFVAVLDHDDICLPERLRRQVDFLRANPGCAAVAAAAPILDGRRLGPDNDPPISEPHVLHWALFSRSVLNHSSICLRKPALDRAGVRYRAEYPVAEDLDLYHQIFFSGAGAIGWLAEPLVIHRRSGKGLSGGDPERARTAAAQVIRRHAEAGLGLRLSQEDVAAMWRLTAERQPARSPDELRRLAGTLAALRDAYCAWARLAPSVERQVHAHAAGLWWSCVRTAARRLGPSVLAVYGERAELASPRPAPERISAWFAAAAAPLRRLRG